MKRKLSIICLGLLLLYGVSGCSDSSSSKSSTTVSVDPTLNETFATTAVENWLGYDYSSAAPDGTTDSDTDGEIDTNDAVVFVETFKSLGYTLPPTTIQGLYENTYTEQGYAEDGTEAQSVAYDFGYTVDSTVTEDDLKNQQWDLLEIGDVIFLDFDQDYAWDLVAVYLGAYAGYTHAAFVVSDYYDEAVVLDLDDENEIINLDISYGYSAVKKPDYENISTYLE